MERGLFFTTNTKLSKPTMDRPTRANDPPKLTINAQHLPRERAVPDSFTAEK
jgi:hypothetical protein